MLPLRIPLDFVQLMHYALTEYLSITVSNTELKNTNCLIRIRLLVAAITTHRSAKYPDVAANDIRQ